MRVLLRTIPAVAFALAAATAVADTVPLAALAQPGRVLMLRHASAPGMGDPPQFRVDDCTTQRNLSAEGRGQAAELGRRLAAAGVAHARVYSSQWCRCLDTARLLALGPVEPLPALNSFFGRSDGREPQTQALRHFLANLPADGPLVVLVTHQVNILALAGRTMASGGGVVLALDGKPGIRVLGEIALE